MQKDFAKRFVNQEMQAALSDWSSCASGHPFSSSLSSSSSLTQNLAPKQASGKLLVTLVEKPLSKILHSAESMASEHTGLWILSVVAGSE